MPPPRPVKPPSAAVKVENKPREETERLVDDVTQEADLLSINPTPNVANQTSFNK